MAEAKGLVFQGQDNTGYATVLDQQPSPQAIMQPLLNKYVDREWDKIQKAEADKKLRDANLAKLQQIVPTWDKTKEVRSQQIEKLIGAGAAIAAAGGDPQTMPEFLKMERDVNYAIEQDTLARDAFGKIIKEYQTGKYDEQVFQKFLDDLEKTSPEEASKLVLNSNPLMPKVTPFEELDKFVPEAATNEQRQGGEYVTKTGVAEETLDAAAKQYGALYPKQLEHLIRTGQAKDATKAKDLIKEEIRRRSKSSTTVVPVPKGGDFNINMAGGGQQIGDFTISSGFVTETPAQEEAYTPLTREEIIDLQAQVTRGGARADMAMEQLRRDKELREKPKVSAQPEEVFVISVSKEGKNIPPFEVKHQGKDVSFSFRDFVIRDGKAFARGKAMKRVGEISINASNEQKDLFIIEANRKGEEVREVDGQLVRFKELPSIVIPYDENKQYFDTHMNFISPYTIAREKGVNLDGKTSGSTPSVNLNATARKK